MVYDASQLSFLLILTAIILAIIFIIFLRQSRMRASLQKILVIQGIIAIFGSLYTTLGIIVPLLTLQLDVFSTVFYVAIPVLIFILAYPNSRTPR